MSRCGSHPRLATEAGETQLQDAVPPLPVTVQTLKKALEGCTVITPLLRAGRPLHFPHFHSALQAGESRCRRGQTGCPAGPRAGASEGSRRRWAGQGGPAATPTGEVKARPPPLQEAARSTDSGLKAGAPPDSPEPGVPDNPTEQLGFPSGYWRVCARARRSLPPKAA